MKALLVFYQKCRPRLPAKITTEVFVFLISLLSFHLKAFDVTPSQFFHPLVRANSIQSEIDKAALDANEDRPAFIVVEKGTYYEPIAMKEYVHLVLKKGARLGSIKNNQVVLTPASHSSVTGTGEIFSGGENSNAVSIEGTGGVTNFVMEGVTITQRNHPTAIYGIDINNGGALSACTFFNLKINCFPTNTISAPVSNAAVILSSDVRDDPSSTVVFSNSVIRVDRSGSTPSTLETVGLHRPNDATYGTVVVSDVVVTVKSHQEGRVIGVWGGGAGPPGLAGTHCTGCTVNVRNTETGNAIGLYCKGTFTDSHTLFFSGAVTAQANEGSAYGAYFAGNGIEDQMTVNLYNVQTSSENFNQESVDVYDYYYDRSGGVDSEVLHSRFVILGPINDPKKVGTKQVSGGPIRRADFVAGRPRTLFVGPRPEKTTGLSNLSFGNFYCLPVVIEAATKIDRLRFEVVTAYQLGTSFQVAVYNQFGDLIRRGQGVDASLPGIKEDRFEDVLLYPGEYVFGIFVNFGGGGGELRGLNLGSPGLIPAAGHIDFGSSSILNQIDFQNVSPDRIVPWIIGIPKS